MLITGQCLVALVAVCPLFPGWRAGGGGGGAAAPSAGGDADEGEPQEEKTQVQRDQRYTVLFGKTAILNMSVKNATGKWDWQNRGKGQMSVRKDTQTGKHYIFFNLDGVSGANRPGQEMRRQGPARLHLCNDFALLDNNRRACNSASALGSVQLSVACLTGGTRDMALSNLVKLRLCLVRFGVLSPPPPAPAPRLSVSPHAARQAACDA
jgi:hypothetical protein